MAARCFLFVVFLSFALPAVLPLTCRNARNEHVDWYIIYKIPRLSNHPNPLVAKGVAHYYMDDVTPQWKLSNVSIQNPGKHALFNTLQQIKKNSGGYALYNDQPPNHHYLRRYGHMKGAVAFNASIGFWLSYSIPKFAAKVGDKYNYRDGETRYGQTAMCITLDYKIFNIIGKLFRYSYPYIYDSYMESKMKGDNPDLNAYITSATKSHVKSPPWIVSTKISTHAGVPLTVYAKYTKYNRDIYGATLSQNYSASFFTETWQHGRGNLPTNCTDSYKVYNIQKLSFWDGITFGNLDDHAKWAVGNMKHILCIADNNRQISQYHRGGGAICMTHPGAWQQFSSRVTTYCPCNNSSCQTAYIPSVQDMDKLHDKQLNNVFQFSKP